MSSLIRVCTICRLLDYIQDRLQQTLRVSGTLGLLQYLNQRTNGPVKAHLISGPSKAQKIKKKQFLTSIKGRNSFANLRKTMIYNTNIDLVNDNVYTKFGLNRSIEFSRY